MEMQRSPVVESDIGRIPLKYEHLSRHVILGVSRSEKNSGDHRKAARTLLHIRPGCLVNRRSGEFQKAVSHRARGCSFFEQIDNAFEFAYAVRIAAAVAGDHDSIIC